MTNNYIRTYLQWFKQSTYGTVRQFLTNLDIEILLSTKI